MRRGTTPTHTIATDIDLRSAEVIYVTYKQGANLVVEKETSDITVEENSVSVTLSQAETLAFSASAEVLVQIRARFSDGSAVASNIMRTSVKDILKDGEI